MRKPKYQKRAVIKSGSQESEPIELTEYTISHTVDGAYVLVNRTTGKRELWHHNQYFAGYCVRIGQKNYEFVSSL